MSSFPFLHVHVRAFVILLFCVTRLGFSSLWAVSLISLERLVELCATNPARMLSLQDRGTFKVGARADVTILDPERAWTYDVSQSKSKSRNTPFDGYRFTGAAIATIVGGRIIYLNRDYERTGKNDRVHSFT